MSRTKKEKRFKEAAPSVEKRVFQEVTRTSRKQRKHPIQITQESEKIRKACLEIGKKRLHFISGLRGGYFCFAAHCDRWG